MAKKDVEDEHRFTVLEEQSRSNKERLDGWEDLFKRIVTKLLALFAATIIAGLSFGLHSEHLRKAWEDLWGGR